MIRSEIKAQLPQNTQQVQQNQEDNKQGICTMFGKKSKLTKKRRMTTILDQSVIIENFFKDTPLNLRKLIKIQAKKPLQSSYRKIYNLNSVLPQETPQIKVISSFLNNGIENESQCISHMDSLSSSQQYCSYKPIEHQRYKTLTNSLFGKYFNINIIISINDKIKKCQKQINKGRTEPSFDIGYTSQINRETFTEFEVKSSEVSDRKVYAQCKINENKNNKKSQIIKARSQKEKKLLRSNNSQLELHKRTKLNEDNQNDCVQNQKNQLENSSLKLNRVLIHQDGQVFEQFVQEGEQNSSIEWQTNKFVIEIQQTQQSLNSFLKKPSKINSLSQHLSILNKCILLNSSTSVGKEVDKFLSTFYQFNTTLPSEGENQPQQLQQNNKISCNISSKVLPVTKQQQFYDDIQSSKQSYCTTSIIHNKQASQLSIEAHSEFTSFQPNQSNSFQAIHSACQNLFQFKIKDTSLLNQYKFSQIKKKQNSQNESQQYKQIDQDQQHRMEDNIDMEEFQVNNEVRQEEQAIDCISNSPAGNKKYGKFHNYNKLFMYNIINMFQTSNLYNFGVPENIQKEIQSIICNLKVNAKKNSGIQGKYPFDYFSHAHYNVLFLQLTPQNIQILQTSEDILNLYQKCYKVDLKLELTSQQFTYINLLKAYFYQIFIECINFEDTNFPPSGEEIISHSSNSRLEYTIKVIKGIQKLVQGVIIKRF